MSKDEALRDLIERVEKAEGPDRELDREIMLAAGYRYEERDIGCRYEDGTVALDWVYVDNKTDKWRSTHPLEFTASIDAAMTLVPEGWRVSKLEDDWLSSRWIAQLSERPTQAQRDAYAKGLTIGWNTADADGTAPALDLCCASLRAHLTQENPNGSQ